MHRKYWLHRNTREDKYITDESTIFNRITYICTELLNTHPDEKYEKELVLAKIKETLLQVAPGAKVILFGSRARNDARSDSDWDILILVDKNKLDPDDFDRISYPLYELGWKINEMISPKLLYD